MFAEVAPAIAFVETITGSGSGVLVGGGYVVTNAHVVWPYHTARVVFSDGSEFEETPVKGWDLLADLAVLGPIDAPGAVALVDGEDLTIGTNVFLIGYPGETEEFPQPTIGRGLLSRVRESDSLGVTYLQTDAPVIGGQSGGALVSEMGDVIGISGFAFTEGNFGIVLSSADAMPRVEQITAGGNPSGLGARQVPLEGGGLRHRVSLGNLWAERAYVVNEPLGTVVDIELVGDNDGALTVYNSFGTEILYLDNEGPGGEIGSFVVNYNEPHFLVASQLSETSGDFVLTSTHALAPLGDPDDGKQIRLGQSIAGNIDFPGDVDYFSMQLTKGETIEIVARSALADAFLSVDYLGATLGQIIVDDDSAGGLFGLDSLVVYRAPHTGDYFLIVEDATYDAPGGYVVTMDSASPDGVTTSTTLAAQLDSSYSAPTSGAPLDFGEDELGSAFAGLPTEFQESESSDLELALAEWSSIGYLSVVFINPEPLQVIIAVSGYLDEAERRAIDRMTSATFLDDVVENLTSTAIADEEVIEIHESGLLESPRVGASSVGAYVDFTSDGTRLRMEFIMFRRGDLLGVVYSSTEPGTQPSVSVERAAGMLDAAMSRVILAR